MSGASGQDGSGIDVCQRGNMRARSCNCGADIPESVQGVDTTRSAAKKLSFLCYKIRMVVFTLWLKEFNDG